MGCRWAGAWRILVTNSGGNKSGNHFWATPGGGATSEQKSSDVRVRAHSASLITGNSSGVNVFAITAVRDMNFELPAKL
jgi:hypothetical protein